MPSRAIMSVVRVAVGIRARVVMVKPDFPSESPRIYTTAPVLIYHLCFSSPYAPKIHYL